MTDDVQKLVEQLEALASRLFSEAENTPFNTPFGQYRSNAFAEAKAVAEAADTLTRLAAERDAALADAARLREALEAIHDMCASAQPTTADRYLDRIDERAATALGETPARETNE